MNPLEFLRLILPPRGWYVGFAIKNEHTPQYSFQTLEGLLNWLTRLDKNGYTTYYACASFRKFQVWDDKQQKNVRRTHTNFLVAADLWIDVDTRESHEKAKYADCQDAYEAVEAFRRHMELPPPLWVGSGGGVHVHWPLAEELELAEWQVYSRGLAAAAKDFKLEIDERKTLDGSAVLRVPGSHNYKFDPPRVVQAGQAVPRYPLAQFAKLKEIGLAEPVRAIRPNSNPSADSPLTRALRGTLFDDPSDPRRAARACAQLGAFIAKPGAFDDNFHYGVAGLCKVSCDGGGDIYLSWLDPEYRDAGQTKLDNWHSDAPATCEYFEGCSPRPELCKACPHYGKISTPAQLGRLAEKKIERLAQARGQPIQIEQAPAGEDVEGLNGFPSIEPPYALRGDKIVWQTEDNNGDPRDVVIVDHPIYIAGRYSSECSKEACYAFRHKQPNRPWETVSVPADEYKSGRGIPLLAKRDVVIRDNQKFLDYAARQLGAVVDTGTIGVRFEQCGFKNDNRDALFADSLFKLGGGIEQAIVSNDIIDRIRMGLGMRPGADVRAYRQLVNRLFVPEHYCAHFNIAMSGGSIFHPWLTTTAGGLIIINWTASSAQGKSMMLWAAGAMWSSSRNALSIRHYDTQASQGILLACLGNIPALFDEINLIASDPQYGVQRLIEFIGKVAQGSDKNRANAFGAGLRSQLGNFGQIILCTSNEDLSDKIAMAKRNRDANDAINKRLQLMDGSSPVEFDQSLGDDLENQMWINGGALMHAYFTRLSDNDVHKHAKKLLQQNADGMWAQHKLNADHRIRMRAFACAKTWAEIAFERGLWPVPSYQHIEDTFGWAVDQIKTRNAASPVQTPKDVALQVLNDYLSINANNTLRVEDAYKRHMIQSVIGSKPQKLLIRWERSTGSIYTPHRAFKQFVVDGGHSWHAICAVLRKLRVIRDERRKITLGAGTEYSGNSAQVECIEFDGHHEFLKELEIE